MQNEIGYGIGFTGNDGFESERKTLHIFNVCKANAFHFLSDKNYNGKKLPDYTARGYEGKRFVYMI